MSKNNKLENSLISIQKVRELMPDQINAYLNFTQKTKSAGDIDEKNKALILVALAVAAQCEMCIENNVQSAIASGASRAEVLESSLLAVSMGGGPKMMYLQYVLDALEV